MNLENTLRNQKWLKDHENAIKALLPETWTHIENLNIVAIGFELKKMGIEWRSNDDICVIFAILEYVGFMFRENMTIRKNTRKIFT